jgi:hypothetical protein
VVAVAVVVSVVPVCRRPLVMTMTVVPLRLAVGLTVCPLSPQRLRRAAHRPLLPHAKRRPVQRLPRRRDLVEVVAVAEAVAPEAAAAALAAALVTSRRGRVRAG